MFHLYDFVAQSTSTNTSDFLQQISSLIALICVLSVLWLGLMAVIFRRERQRRSGHESAPPHARQGAGGLRGLMGGRKPSATVDELLAQGDNAPLMPTPDLDMFTSDLAELQDDPAPLPTLDAEQMAHPLQLDDPPPAQDALQRDSGEAVEPAPDDDAAPSMTADAVELLRVWRDLSDGSLVLEINGQRFRSLADLRSAELERRFRTVVRDLQSLQAAPAPTAPASAPVQVSRPSPTAPPRPPEAGPAESLETVTMRPSRMFRDMARAARGDKPEPFESAPVLTITDQIEERLQQRLASAPEFAARQIHVRAAPGGSVRIEVDGTYYDGVGAVADDAVRTLILDVVRQWEASQ